MNSSLRPPTWIPHFPPFRLHAQTMKIRSLIWYSPRHPSLLLEHYFMRQSMAGSLSDIAYAKERIYAMARQIKQAQVTAVQEKQSRP